MNGPHSAVSRRSAVSASSVGTCNAANHEGNYRVAVHVLYQELQTQLCDSYRPHVEYVPPEPAPEYGAKFKLKTAKNVISAMNRFQRRDRERVNSGNRNDNVLEKQDSSKSIDNVVLSQSIPNLTGKTSPSG